MDEVHSMGTSYQTFAAFCSTGSEVNENENKPFPIVKKKKKASLEFPPIGYKQSFHYVLISFIFAHSPLSSQAETTSFLIGWHKWAYFFKMAAVVDASNKFALDLHKTLRAQGSFAKKNLFYSPSSLSVALGMTFSGARENTATEMAKVLHWEALADVHGEMKNFLQDLKEANSARVEVSTANRLYLQKDYPVVESFLEEMTKSYQADVPLVDYVTDSEGVRVQVNKWVEEQTKNKIKDLIAPGVFNSLTRLTLVNAIYFKGAWLSEFKKERTTRAPFYVTPARKVDVPMMRSNAKFKSHEDEDLQCHLLELPYQREELSMILLLPFEQDGLAKLEGKLTAKKLKQAVDHLVGGSPRKLDVSIPKFKLTEQFQFKDILVKMGARDMFDEFKADFSGIVPLSANRLFVSHVIHKAFIEVNEEGTEAAAASAVVMMSRMMIQPFCADHPFLFLIRHNKTGAVLFLGSLVDPTSSAKWLFHMSRAYSKHEASDSRTNKSCST